MIIQHQTTQNNTSNQIFSQSVENSSKQFNSNVSYRTQEEINAIERHRYPLLQHPKTLRKSGAGYLLKLIVGRKLKYGSCITKQVTFAREIKGFGYDKNLSERQINRLVIQLTEAKLITHEKVDGKLKSVHSYNYTKLGKDVYDYILNGNSGKTIISLLELDDDFEVEIPNEHIVPEKNVCQYISPSHNKNHMDINTHTSERFVDNFNEVEQPTAQTVRKIDLNAKPIDLDEQPFENFNGKYNPYQETHKQDNLSKYREAGSTLKIRDFTDFHDESAPVSTLTSDYEEIKTKVNMRKNTSFLPYGVFQAVNKNFGGVEADVLISILERVESADYLKIIIVERIVDSIRLITEGGGKVGNFGGLSYSVAKKTLDPEQNKYIN